MERCRRTRHHGRHHGCRCRPRRSRGSVALLLLIALGAIATYLLLPDRRAARSGAWRRRRSAPARRSSSACVIRRRSGGAERGPAARGSPGDAAARRGRRGVPRAGPRATGRATRRAPADAAVPVLLVSLVALARDEFREHFEPRGPPGDRGRRRCSSRRRVGRDPVPAPAARGTRRRHEPVDRGRGRDRSPRRSSRSSSALFLWVPTRAHLCSSSRSAALAARDRACSGGSGRTARSSGHLPWVDLPLILAPARARDHGDAVPG